jgi:hypothetical protein
VASVRTSFALVHAPGLDVVFADATVPPESGENRIVGSAALEFLSGLARDGIVPP